MNNILDDKLVQPKTNEKLTPGFAVVVLMILAAAATRFLPHPPNFTPITGMALFGAAYFAKKYWAIIIPFVALWFSSVILDNVIYAHYYDGFQWMSQPYVFLSMIAIVGLGFLSLKKITFGRLVGTSLVASTLFFLISNFGAWAMDISGIYPDTFAGLMACYAAGLPYFLNTIAGDLLYVGVLFGGFAWVANQRPDFAKA